MGGGGAVNFAAMRFRLFLSAVLACWAWSSGPVLAHPFQAWCAPVGEVAAATASHPGVLLGPLTREQIEDTSAEWVKSEVAAQPDATATAALYRVAPGAEVTIYLGTWCSDSRREVGRLWHALDQASTDGTTLPFTIRYIGIDEAKQQPADMVAQGEVRFLPTIVVTRDGKSVGRIVESSPHGVERDLLDLLEGRESGLLTENEKLKAKPTPPPPSRR
jgi:hypothetical protein